MKLYTEEQVANAVMFGRWGGTTKKDYQEFLNKLTPIELPSDEEIDKEASDFGKKYRATTYEISAHVIGAKWMRDKILDK